jgi:hypothetical protein
VTESLLTEADRRQLEARGLSEEDALRQIGLLTNPPERIRLLRPAIPGDGIVRIGVAGLGAAVGAEVITGG